MEKDPSSDDTWDERLGWAFGLISETTDERVRARQRLVETRERWIEALRSYNQVWNQRDHPQYRARSDALSRSYEYTFPHAMWRRRTIPLSRWQGLPYALLYLEWEIRHPDEWRAFNDSWGTKKSILRDLERGADELPAATRRQLGDLVVRVARREYHCEDVRYARLGRRLDSPALRHALEALGQGPAATGRRHARYLLWLLDHPEVAQPKAAQWHDWLAHHTD